MSFSPKDAEQFFLGDLDVYIDSETLPAFYTQAEKPITFIPGLAIFIPIQVGITLPCRLLRPGRFK